MTELRFEHVMELADMPPFARVGWALKKIRDEELWRRPMSLDCKYYSGIIDDLLAKHPELRKESTDDDDR